MKRMLPVFAFEIITNFCKDLKEDGSPVYPQTGPRSGNGFCTQCGKSVVYGVDRFCSGCGKMLD